MTDQFDRASEYEQIERDAAIARALAARPAPARSRLCEHCEEHPHVAGSANCARCDLELSLENAPMPSVR